RRLGTATVWKLDEASAAGPGEAGPADLRQRVEGSLDGRFAAAQDRLERIVEHGSGNEVGYFRGRGITRQIRVTEQGRGGHVDARIGQHVPGRWQLHGMQLLPHPFGPGAAPAHEHRHVRPQAQAQGGQHILVQVQAPEPVQRTQDGCSVGRTATETTPGRNALFDDDVCTKRASGVRLQEPGSTYGKVVDYRDPGDRFAMADDAPVLPDPQAYGVAPVQQAEDGLQLVVTVGPAPGDAQEQVQLGRGRPLGPGAHGALHPSTTSRTRAEPRSACSRRGMAGKPSCGGSHSWYSMSQPDARMRCRRPSGPYSTPA